MAILKANTFEGGAAGTAVTTGNSGGVSGDAFTLVSAPAGSTLTYASDVVAHGSRSLLVDGSADSSSVYAEWTHTASAQAAYRFYIYPTALPTTSPIIAVVRSASAAAVRVILSGSGKLALQNAAGATVWTAVDALPLNTWSRVELTVVPGASTTTGQAHVAYYAADATAVTEEFSSAALDAGTVAVSVFRIGKQSGQTAAFYVDDVAVADTATFIGVPATNVTPTANAGPDRLDVEPWAPVTIGGLDSDPDGTIASIAWTQIAGPATPLSSTTVASPTLTAPGTLAGTTLTYRKTVTDNGGATSPPDDVSVTVLPVTERAVIGGVEVPMQIRAT